MLASPWKKTGAVVVFWTVFAIAVTIQNYAIFHIAGKPVDKLHLFGINAAYAYLWAAVTPLVLWLSRRFPIERSAALRNALLHLAIAALLGALTKFTWELIVYFYFEAVRGPLVATRLIRSIASMIDYEMLLYGVLVLADHGITYSRRYREGQVRASNLEASLAQAQLQALKMQLDPHFLFNTLHAIAELVHEDPEAAERMIVRLSELLRASLDSAGTHEVPLRRELDFLHRYLEIEKIRFDDRLAVTFDVDPAALEAGVPNLLLQPLVENAIRHGIGNNAEGGIVMIQARRRDTNLEMRVEDSGSRNAPDDPILEGVGLRNTRTRLEMLYGPAQQLVLRRNVAGGFEVDIVIPFRVHA